jgi:hypothetical protein
MLIGGLRTKGRKRLSAGHSPPFCIDSELRFGIAGVAC